MSDLSPAPPRKAPVMIIRTRGLLLSDSFLFGASTSAHQTEGGNTNSDWWQLEHGDGPVKEPSGDAADSYHRWHVDMDLLAELGFTDYRFSIEWARIEPAPGHFSRAAIAHYRRMVEGALERGLRPMVTLHHFTVPRWFADQGGWTADGAVDRFARYVAATAPVIGSGVGHVCTINEPDTVAVLGAVAGPGTEEPPPAVPPMPDRKLTDALIHAHRRAVAVVKGISPGIQAGWSVAHRAHPAPPGAEDVTVAYRYPHEDVFLQAAREDDWIGVQASTLVGPLGGWGYHPAALGHALRHTARVVGDVPLIVTENGVSTADDTHRVDCTTHALQDLAAAIADGLDIRGYFHRSALDAYEWGSYRPTFGLIAVDPETFLRAPRPSARWLGGIARSGVLPLACP